jgi:diadenosine tetraphosphate (Ap4A) HIT family hydrolase
MRVPGCVFCDGDAGVVVHRAGGFRIVRADEPGFPAFYRVVADGHVAEFTDLDDAARLRCMACVAAVERALRSVLAPRKINVASLGNVVPHLHWHVVARFDDDRCFPAPVWSLPLRDDAAPLIERLRAALPALDAAVASAAAAADLH